MGALRYVVGYIVVEDCRATSLLLLSSFPQSSSSFSSHLGRVPLLLTKFTTSMFPPRLELPLQPVLASWLLRTGTRSGGRRHLVVGEEKGALVDRG